MKDREEPGETDRLPEDVRRRLREGLSPEPAQVARVVSRALAEPAVVRRVRPQALAAAIGVLVLAAAAVALLLNGRAGWSPSTAEGDVLTITNRSGRLVVLGLPAEDLPRVSNVGGVFWAELPGEEPRYLVMGGDHGRRSD